MNELAQREESRSPAVIVAEIRAYSNNALASLVEVGRRLAELKEAVPHGEYGKWLERAGYSKSGANNLVRLYQGYGAAQGNLFGAELGNSAFGRLGYSQALELLALPEEARTEFLENEDVEHMSVRELREAIRAKTEAEAERDRARAAADQLSDQLAQAAEDTRAAREAEQKANEAFMRADRLRAELYQEAQKAGKEAAALQAELAELRNRPPVVRVETVADEKAVEAARQAEIEKAAKERRALEKKLAAAEKKAQAAEEAAKQAETEAEEARTRAESAEALRQEDAARLRKAAAAGDSEAARFGLLFDQTVSSINQMTGILKLVRNREDRSMAQKIEAALSALSEKVKGAITA